MIYSETAACSLEAYDKRDIECEEFDTQLIIRQWQGLTIVAFRGTGSGTDVKQDLKRLQRDYGHGDVHRGFVECYESVAYQLRIALKFTPSSKLVFTGHSLGGALAQLAALDYPYSACITFGAPAVGDEAFCRQLAAQCRSLTLFENMGDIVTYIPFFGYSKPRKAITRLWSWPKWIGWRPSYHSMSLYQELANEYE